MKFVIVGGGISGWLSALIFSHRKPNHEYVIIESSEVNTIGVGEGTTGLFVETIEELPDINVAEFLRETKATPKIGIEFNNWSGKGSTFFNPIDGTPTTNEDFDSFLYFTYTQNQSLDTSSLHGLLKRKNKSPYTGRLEDYNSALHLDNKLTIQYLKNKSLKRKNIKYISDTVSKIKRDETGKVLKIICSNHIIEGDIFIDCTGYSRIFSEKSDWVSFKDNLPMNSVTTFTRKHSVSMVTKADKLNLGWCWQIPTQERIGCGYVSCDEWGNNVVDEIKSNYPDAKILKSFKFDSGKLKKSWNQNVISLGLAYHFLEPLQATNIHLTLVQIDILCQRCIRETKDRTLNPNIISIYNNHIDNLIEDFKNFINIHYSRDSRVTLTDYNKKIISLLKVRGLFYEDLPQMYGCSGIGLWGHTLLGLNHITKQECHTFLSEMNLYGEVEEISSELQTTLTNTPFLSYQELIKSLSI
tara:strand:+ start:87 stop:1496 length:1410 start_codon:yes stop_codon:yes gene_type:complete